MVAVDDEESTAVMSPRYTEGTVEVAVKRLMPMVSVAKDVADVAGSGAVQVSHVTVLPAVAEPVPPLLT